MYIFWIITLSMSLFKLNHTKFKYLLSINDTIAYRYPIFNGNLYFDNYKYAFLFAIRSDIVFF